MYRFIFLILWLTTFAAAQLAGKVGPRTSHETKSARKVCNINSYGARPGKSGDIGPALNAAFQACKSGGTIVIPAGDWGMSTWVNMNGGTGFAIQWDGVIYRSGEGSGGNMLLVQRSDDVEIFSTNGRGAFQGNGYQYHARGSREGPRILRFVRTTNFSVHDVMLIDSPSFHFSMDNCKNGEIYNMVVKGAYEGGIDGIDIWSDNMWVHDVMVTNKDECVTIKSPAHNVLVENIYCNWSGGSAFGSLGDNVDVANIHYRNIYTVNSNQMMMIKSNGGSGSVKNVIFENFIGYSNAYTFDIDQHWSPMKVHEGAGVALSNITIKGWRGTCANGAQRPPIKINCADGRPCTNIRISDFEIWTDSGNEVIHSCRSAYGSGACLKSGNGGAYGESRKIISSPPSGYRAPRMQWDLRSSPGTTIPIPIPSMPTSFFPGTRPIKPLAGGGRKRGVNTTEDGFFDPW